MKTGGKILLVCAVSLFMSASPGIVRADETPASCGLTDIDSYSGVIIESCVDPQFPPIDVWIDGNRMYVARAADHDNPDSQRVRVYDISNVENPVHLDYLDGSQSSVEAVGSVGVGGGNGVAFAANDCDGGCPGPTINATAFESCDGWDSVTLTPGAGWNDEVADQGIHTLFYDTTTGFLFAANNSMSSAGHSVPFWDIPSCPVTASAGIDTISVPFLDNGASHIHEVAVANERLAVSAWTDLVVFDMSGFDGDPDDVDVLAHAEDGQAYHSAWPFESNKYIATEERDGGRFRAYYYLNAVDLVPKGSHQIPGTKTRSYHEVVYAGSSAYASAYQAGLRTWYWDDDEGDLLFGPHFDTSNAEGAQGNAGEPWTWVGALGISAGASQSGRRIVAISNLRDGGSSADQRVFLLSVHTPDSNGCTGITCTATAPTPGGNAPTPDLLVARSTDNGVTQSGKLIRYPTSGSGLGTPSVLTQSGLTAGHDYGYSIATGDFNRDGLIDVAVGAAGQTVGSVKSGRVYVYKRTATGFVLLQTIDQTGLGSNAAGERFGASLAAGDFDHDGDDDLVVGAPAANEVSGQKAGAVFLYRASTSGLATWSVIANTTNVREGDRYGASVVSGDFNGDGTKDFVVAAPQGRVSSASPHSGVIHIYRGVSGALPTFHSRKGQAGLDTDELPDRFGSGLAVGDWNNDNRDDLVVGAPGEHVGDISSGKLYAFLGSNASMLVAWRAVDQTGLDTNEEPDMFARRLTAGDFNADGYDDVAVGAPGEFPGTAPRAGRVYVFRGATTGLLTQVQLDQAGLQTNDDLDGFGERLGAGDWNNDGKLDLIVVAPGMPNGSATNPLFLYKGSASGPIAWQTLTLP